MPVLSNDTVAMLLQSGFKDKSCKVHRDSLTLAALALEFFILDLVDQTAERHGMLTVDGLAKIMPQILLDF
ncbi:hypothetical protein BASA50_002864 [Batrachochytrium salamandrivorans]|uniref:Centromere protein X n=1 Tax=Batrachochytrium salamandrivorans TaxID=1357716 RepID=A0ABQ8FK64_9FUNG|nr:hypothetical protein BASA60_008281 [Batrachochytrium salamandrivorans]KAH6576388.1 hypothetical protein BASA62_001437 [Batrachochytrium salamandrivorans]KAH6579523.1 hypothetical protein BASA61_010205 [Batrachochytrium salamandrivorans]KAH6597904.1 hypothetical protein BASA61_003010 [Batrachochytrium salamandrivorans]KAH6599667.1 hypothetical protein BASA50_002864 [Batrachochytrium salamandrivorans]